MRQRTPALSLLAGLLLVASCGGGGSGTDGGNSNPDADPNAPDADPFAPDADPFAPDADPNAPDAGSQGCDEGQTQCGPDCVDIDTNDQHCGDCFHDCNPGETCVIGNCVAGVGALVLSELHAQEPAYVELYNGGTTAIDLAGHQLQWNTDAIDTGAFVLPAYSLGPGQFVVLREGTGSNGGGVLHIGDTVSWRNHVAVRLLAPGGLGLDFVRTGASAVAPPTGTSWNGANALNPNANVDQSLVRNVWIADTDSAADWFLAGPASPGDYCGQPGRCGDACYDFGSDRNNCGDCGVTCGSTQLCIDGECRTGLGGPWISEYRRYPRPGVEIHNPSASPIDITGYRIDISWTTNLSYTFPGYTLAPGGFVFVYMGPGEPHESTLFAGPSAAFSGDAAIALYDDASVALDFVRFGSSAIAAPSGTFWFGANVTSPQMGIDQGARRDIEIFDTDSAADWLLRSPSTPGVACLGSSSVCAGACAALDIDPDRCGDCATSCGDHESCRAGTCTSAGAVVISEIKNSGTEGFEVTNASAAAVDLTGWQLEWAADGGGDTYTIGAITLAPGERRWFDETASTVGNTVGMNKAINWSTHISVALKNDGGSGIDFVRTATSVTTPPTGTAWIGSNADNPSAASATESLRRDVHTADTDSAADWTLGLPSIGRACPTAAESVCGGGCADLMNDRDHCGACGNACPYGSSCYQGGCVEPGSVRLAAVSGGNGVSSGRPEVFVSGGWYTMWGLDTTDATVICRQLGFSSGTAGTNTTCGTCAGYLNDIICTGDEARVADCPHTTFTSAGNGYGYHITCTP